MSPLLTPHQPLSSYGSHTSNILILYNESAVL